MWRDLVALWLAAMLLMGLAWYRTHGVIRGQAMRWGLRLIGYGGATVLAWEWVGKLPLGGIFAKLALASGLLWYIAYRVWTEVLPTARIRNQQRQRLRVLTGEQDPRDLRHLKWRQGPYDRDRAITPYLRPQADAYWLARSDPVPSKRWWGSKPPSAYDVVIPSDLMLRHVLVLGSTGAGKTRTALQGIIEQQISRGLGALILQFKHDELFYRGIFDAARRAGRDAECIYFSLRADDDRRTAAFNPLDWPNSAEAAEAVVQAALEDVVALRYFAAQNLDALGIVLDGAKRQGETMSFDRLAPLLGQTGRSGAGQPLLAYLRQFPDLRARAQRVRWEHASELKMLAAQLGRFAALTPTPGRVRFDLRTAIQQGQVVVANLDATTFPKAARFVGRLIIAMLSTAYSGLRRTERDPLYLVALDEFGPVAGPHLSSVLSTARGFGMSLLLATQSLADLRVAGQREAADALAAQVVENIGTQIVFGLRNPQDARWWSQASGTILRDDATDVLVGGRDGENFVNRRQAVPRESGAVSTNQFLFAPRSKAFVWVPSQRCLREPGCRPASRRQEPDQRSVVLANFALPPEPGPWPEVAGGSIGEPQEPEAIESRATPGASPGGPSRSTPPSVPPFPYLLAGGAMGPTLLGSVTHPLAAADETTTITKGNGSADAGGEAPSD